MEMRKLSRDVQPCTDDPIAPRLKPMEGTQRRKRAKPKRQTGFEDLKAFIPGAGVLSRVRIVLVDLKLATAFLDR